ncbi:hypothetical protein CYMTET_8171 [Cymbomonas tetramitiformis]|uniref:Uncharacterized protein n=1 Tax=Cymbomonas tetramitiformis TaxID=36881 RepID=A0AAE0GVF3_9CHLO|nr:hypothetical protein CYMTET_8171 [Cymbomonas tetramitiformis]
MDDVLNEVTDSYLRLTLKVCEVFEEAISTTFGPLGLDKLIVANGEQLQVTRSGTVILDNLSVDHFIGAYLQQIVKCHAANHGDGSSAFVIMLTAAIRQVTREVSTAQGVKCGYHAPRHNVIGLIRELSTLRSDYFTDFLTQHLVGASVMTRWRDEGRARAFTLGLLHTAFAGQLGPAGIICKMCAGDRKKPRPSEVLMSMRQNPPVVVLPGGPVASSSVLEGVLITEGLRSRHMPATAEPVKFLMAKCDLETVQMKDGVQSAVEVRGRYV